MTIISAKIVADSISVHDERLTTLQLCYPRFIHAEFMTHRVFSRNASSSRAIPVAKMIEQVRTNPAMPIHWGKNQPGMQANEQLDEPQLSLAKTNWLQAARAAADYAEEMNRHGVHKQVANRILEPFQYIHVVVTATEWENFFQLRAHPDAQPEIHKLALQMQAAMAGSEPKALHYGEWHLPYVTDQELESAHLGSQYEILRKVSAARCARVSYLKHDGTASDIGEDLALYERLAGMVPLHASPIEHQATPDVYYDEGSFQEEGWESQHLHGNFKGWVQFRKLVEIQHYNQSATTD